MLLQSIGETYNPNATDILLMVSAGILFFAVLIWRRYTPDNLRSKLVFNKVKKAWLLMSSEEEKVAYTRLMVEAAKSDGKVTGEESDALFEEMDKSIKQRAAKMPEDDMFQVVRQLSPEVKKEVFAALQELLYADGDFDPKEAEWLAGVMTKIS